MKASTSPFSEPSINSASEAIALLGLTPRFQPDIANQPPKCSGSNAPPSAAALQGDPWAAPSVRVIWPDGAQTRLTDGQSCGQLDATWWPSPLQSHTARVTGLARPLTSASARQ